jgi:hypothetical protein
MNAPFNHHAEIVALREENDILRETVRQLREDLAPVVAFPNVWKLTPQQTTVLSCIMAASPGVASFGRMLAALYWNREVPDGAENLLNVLVFGIRKRLLAAGTDAGIQNVFGRGYTMPIATRDHLLAMPEGVDTSNPHWWAEARRLRAEGGSYRQISEVCRKSHGAVFRALNAECRAVDIENKRLARRRFAEADAPSNLPLPTTPSSTGDL